jgi:hypothetical protein
MGRIDLSLPPGPGRLLLAFACLAARTAASRGLGGNAGTGAVLGSCPAGLPYGNVPIKAIMGTLGLCHLGSGWPI